MAHLFYFHFPLQITKIVLLFFFSWNIRRFEIFKREFEWSMMTSKQAQSFSTLSYHRALHCIGHWTPLIHCKGIVEISGTPVKFIYSEKATQFCELFPLLLTTVHTVKSKGKSSQNFVAFSEYMNFNLWAEKEFFISILIKLS